MNVKESQLDEWVLGKQNEVCGKTINVFSIDNTLIVKTKVKEVNNSNLINIKIFK